MPSHRHISLTCIPAVCLSDYVKETRKQFVDKGRVRKAFTYTLNDKARIINYIKNQKEHHKQRVHLMI